MPEINKKELGKRIKSIRKKYGETLAEFGARFDPPANRSLVSAWENGRYVPNDSRIKKISEIGGIDTNELLYGDIEEYVRRTLLDDGVNYSDLVDETALFFKLIKVNNQKDNKPVIYPDKERILEQYNLNSNARSHREIEWGDNIIDYDFVKKTIETKGVILNNESNNEQHILAQNKFNNVLRALKNIPYSVIPLDSFINLYFLSLTDQYSFNDKETLIQSCEKYMADYLEQEDESGRITNPFFDPFTYLDCEDVTKYLTNLSKNNPS